MAVTEPTQGTRDTDQQMSPARNFFYRPELDVLRLVAFLLVFAHHTLPAPAGNGTLNHLLRAIGEGTALGVPLFFLLSAYLITELLFRERRLTGTINLRGFYIRRILRIWPLYFAVLGIAATAGILGLSGRVPLTGMLAYLLLTGNWWTSVHGFLPVIAGPLWSISIEEQFYLFWPAYMRSASRRAVFFLAAAVWIVSQFLTFWLSRMRGATADHLWTNSFVQFQYFAIGILLAVIFHGGAWALSWAGRVALCGFGLLCIFLPDHKYDILGTSGRVPAPAALFVYGVAGVGVAAIFCGFLGAPLPRWSGLLTYLGRISYGLYVFHLGLIIATLHILTSARITSRRILYIWLITLPFTALCAHLSFNFFERPFLRLKERFEVVKTRQA